MEVYLNGQFVEESQAAIGIDDRGFLFGDGVYEVVHVYGGRLFAWDGHMARLERSLAAIGIGGVSTAQLRQAADRLLASFPDPDGALYVEVTRGVQRRSHAPPAPGVLAPTVLMWIRPVTPFPAAMVADGVSVVTVPDDRWAKVWIKTIGLLPNVLAKGRALEAGAFDAIFVRDGMVTEATSANVFMVRDGVLRTAPVSNYILPGITREVVLKLAQAYHIPVSLLPFSPEEMKRADEVFLCGTLTEVMPVTRIDDQVVGHGAGPVARRLLAGLHQEVGKGA
ncbi:MAG: aminotransferase class IV [Thermaerobacter sp.]|nr:aminotransferase class IV [Thermaerobacter sp.]